MYLLDTCVISDFVRRYPATLRKIHSLDIGAMYVASITLSELEFGFVNHPLNASKAMPIVMELYAQTQTIDLGIQEAVAAAHIRNDLKSRGLMIGKYDLLIAATALVHDLTLVTSNVAEFGRIKGLRHEDWRVLEGG